MNLDTLKEIVKIAKDQGVSELEVEAKEFKVSVSFSTGYAPIVQHAPIVHQAPAAQPISGTAVVKPATDAGLHVIKSPFVGTFYASPSPGKPVYTKIGDKVKSGQALCVLEAMKIMNEIESDINGEIVEICVDNESAS
jgi:acetyl-CoA carboxylase biotin carboxyl carrier protein